MDKKIRDSVEKSVREGITYTWKIEKFNMIYTVYNKGLEIGTFFIPHHISGDTEGVYEYLHKVMYYYVEITTKTEKSLRNFHGTPAILKKMSYETIEVGDGIYLEVEFNEKRIALIYLPLYLKGDMYNTQKMAYKVVLYYHKLLNK